MSADASPDRVSVDRAARDIWVYFKSFGRAGEGAGETGRWFDENKSLGGPQWLINRLEALSAAYRPTGEAVAWRGQTDGIDECTVRPETRDDWTRYGRKITPLCAIPPAPSADSGVRTTVSREWLIAIINEHSFAQDAAEVILQALPQPAPQEGEGR